VATDPAASLTLTPVNAEGRSLEEWLTTFHLASVVIDPYTNESAWILDTAARILRGFRGAAVRVNFVCTSDAEGARAFLGPLADEFLVFADPDRAFAASLGLAHLPAFVFVGQDGTVKAAAEGWNPAQWRSVAQTIAKATAWSYPTIPAAGDPPPYQGSPAAG
jgi:hypothetical protein